MTGRRSAESVSLILIALAAALFSSNFLLDLAFADTEDWASLISALEVSEGHPRVLLRVTDALCGLLVLALMPYVHAALPSGRWRRWTVPATVVYAAAGAGAALVPLPCADADRCTSTLDDIQRLTHDGFSIVAQGGLFVAVVAVGLATRRRGPAWLHRAAWLVFVLGGVVGTAVSGYASVTDAESLLNGLAQRFQLTVVSVWIICLGVYAATDGLDARGPLRVRSHAE